MEAEDSKSRGAIVAVKQGAGFNPSCQRLIGVFDSFARERCLMLQPTPLLLPEVGRGDVLVAINASFPELEDPLDNSWGLRYETSPWYSWMDLQANALSDRELSTLRNRRSRGVYEVVRAWEESGNPNPFLYVGWSSSGSLGERIRTLVRQPAKESHAQALGKRKPYEPQRVRDKIIAHAKEVLGLEEDRQVLPWLYIRWSVCDAQIGPALLDYYLHFLRDPLFPEGKVHAQTGRQEGRDEWWVRKVRG
jgi:hypothetical protein